MHVQVRYMEMQGLTYPLSMVTDVRDVCIRRIGRAKAKESVEVRDVLMPPSQSN